MAKIIKIHHIGIAVNETGTAAAFWKDALGLPLNRVEDVPAQKSQVSFFPVGESEIELVKPLVDDSPIARFLSEKGAGIHHICLQVDNIIEMIGELKNKNIRMINETPLTEKGRLMAFVHPKSTGGVLVELYQVL
ncbi:MAG TPA: methylmalonyl-CoA epimerase [Leptolinea sp.]